LLTCLSMRGLFLVLILILSPILSHAGDEIVGEVTTAPEAEQKGWIKEVSFELGKKISSIPLSADRFLKNEPQKETEAGFCQNCDRTSRRNDLVAQSREMAEQADPNDPHGYRLPGSFTAACSQAFLTREGLGPWGKAMVNSAVKVAPSCFYHRNLFGSICPNYLSLSAAQKNAMIAMAFAAIAQTESACVPKAEAPGVNDLAVGMFQLEKSPAVRRQAGRNSKWCKTHENVNAKGWQFQSECSVSIIEDTVCSWRSNLFDSAGYWEKLRNNREITQRIRETVKKWKVCQ